MTDIFKTPGKLSHKQRLFEIAVETLQRKGWKVERAFGAGKGSVRRIRKDDKSLLVSIRTSQDQYIAFTRNAKDTGWGTLADVDVVIPVSVDDSKHPTAALVHWIDAAEMRARFDRAYKARRDAHHKLSPGRGHWLALYLAEDRTVPSLVGAGAGVDSPPIARVPLNPDGAAPAATNGSGPVDEAGLDVRGVIADAKRMLAKSLGIPESNIKISIEA